MDGLASTLERRSSRRRFLARVAVASSAMAVAPLRYLLHPEPAHAVIARCASCLPGSACCDGWTTFCCTINDGVNACPPNSYVAGWWKCTNYRGSRLCEEEGVRYYMDCNRRPGARCSDGCRCAGSSCGNRSTCCNLFRYGQCNADVPQLTEIVCRTVMCVNPCTVYSFCDCSEKVDNETCRHDASCL